MAPAFPQRPRPAAFVADAMLGRLARWLRILGHDTLYERDASDDVLIDRVLGENRWLLTRDGYLARRRVLRGRHTLLMSDQLVEQLGQLHTELGLELEVGARSVSRCTECNSVLEAIPYREAVLHVPPFVATQHADFVRCPGCGRVYWPGTHWARILGQLARLRGS